MFPRRGDAVCTSRRCELRHLAAWAERVITRRQIDVSVDGVGVRHPRLQQLSPCLLAGSRQYPRVGEVELMHFLQRVHKDGAPLRPIVSLKETPTYGMAKWLFRRLKFLTAESETTVSSSAQFLEKLKGRSANVYISVQGSLFGGLSPRSPPTYGLARWLFRRLKFLTADSDTTVCSSTQFLEKLKGDLAIETVQLLLRNKYDETENRLGHAQVLQLLKFCLRTYFTFDGTIYEQVKGTPMGSPISGFIAVAVLQRRFQAVRDSRTGSNQVGFRAGCADQIFTLRRILEFRHSYQQPTAVCFIDFAAAFDSVHRESLWRIMALDGVLAKIISMIKAYYRSTTARVLVRNNFSQPFAIRSGVRQGCILSPILFNYAIDRILGRALRESDGGEFAPGHRLTDLDYADDIALLASSFGDLQSMVSRVNEVAKSVGLSINAGKTKVFSSCIPDQEKASLGIDDCQLEEAFGNAYGTDVTSPSPQIRVYRASVRSVLLYGCECWDLRVEDERKLEVFDHHCLRTILRVKFTDFVSNETVPARCDNISRITQAIQERRLRWFGHVLRCPPQELSVTALDRSPLFHWRRRRGGQFKTWLDTVRQDMEVVLGLSVFGLRRWPREWVELSRSAAADRHAWRGTVRDIVEAG
nr:unnamed protein product [Spirometra erinaceieuropaei]